MVRGEQYCCVREWRRRRGPRRTRTQSLREKECIGRPLDNVIAVCGTGVIIGRGRRRGRLEGVKVGKEALVVTYALLYQPANLLAERSVGEHTPVRLKLRPVGPTEWPFRIANLDAAVTSVLDVAETELCRPFTGDSFADALKVQDPLLDQVDGILKIGHGA